MEIKMLYKAQSEEPISGGNIAKSIADAVGLKERHYATITQHPPKTYSVAVYTRLGEKIPLLTVSHEHVVRTPEGQFNRNQHMATEFDIEADDTQVTHQVVENVQRALGLRPIVQ